jgi:hypothetical protein
MPQRAVEVILENWREVERRLADADVGTPKSERLQAEASRLRDEYHRYLDALRDAQRPGSATPPDRTVWGERRDGAT